MSTFMILAAGFIVGGMIGINLMLILISLSMRDFWRSGK